MRLPGAATVALALLVLAAAVPADARAARSRIVVRGGVTQPVFSYADAVRETVYVESSIDSDLDGDLDLLATDIIRPKETESGLKVPVIYEMSPYYAATGRGNEAEIKNAEDGDFVPEAFPLFYDNYFVPRGYAVVLQDMPGTRNSEGCMDLGGPGELAAGAATVDWLNGRGRAVTAAGEAVEANWSTGKVGMIGKSYDGSVANGTASTGVEGLETIVPIAAISRWYDYHLNNGVQYLNAYLTPALFTLADQEPGDDMERGNEWYEDTLTENTTCSAKGDAIVAQAANPAGDYNAFWDERDYLKDVDKVKASVFLIHGLNDYNVKPNNFVHWWLALAENDVPRKIWLAQIEHVDPFDFRRTEWVRTLHRWFDYWLQDVDNGIMDEPMVDIEREAGRWFKESTWPAARARNTKVYLGPDQQLTSGPAPEGGLSVSFTDEPTQGEDSMVDKDSPNGARVIFVSPKLPRNVRISGRVIMNVFGSIDRPDTNFTGLLVDYGTAKRVRPSITTTRKESCHGESTASDNSCYYVTKKQTDERPMEIVTVGWLDARHAATLRMNTPIVPNQKYKFTWDLLGDDYVFLKGHRIGVVVAGSDFSFTIPDPFMATTTVDLGRSHIVLPVVGGRRALGF